MMLAREKSLQVGRNHMAHSVVVVDPSVDEDPASPSNMFGRQKLSKKAKIPPTFPFSFSPFIEEQDSIDMIGCWMFFLLCPSSKGTMSTSFNLA